MSYDYKILPQVSEGEFATVETLASMETEFIKQYFAELRQLKAEELVQGCTKDYMTRLNETSINAYRIACERDFWFEYSFLKINVKQGGNPIVLVPNNAQIILMKKIKAMEEAGIPVRIILLKMRQWGGSSFIGGFIYLKIKRELNTRALVSADKDSNAKNLFNMYSTYFIINLMLVYYFLITL